jgi:drug/metabolite transporter (DMT)-like permease
MTPAPVTGILFIAGRDGHSTLHRCDRPGFQAINKRSVLAMEAGALLALYFIVTRHIAGQSPAMLTTFHTNLMGARLPRLLMPGRSVTHQPRWNGGDCHAGAFFNDAHLRLCLGAAVGALCLQRDRYGHPSGLGVFRRPKDRWTLLGVAIVLSATLAAAVQGRAEPRRAE